ncbi:MAG TPA: GntR family transcriptional regulator [Phycisphaeraceae bacterium]
MLQTRSNADRLIAPGESGNLKLRDRAYGYIRQQLVSGRLAAGSRLSVDSLAKEIGISRTPVAEALLRLQMEGVVEQVPRVGTIVRQPDVKEIADLYELREILESHAAAHAAKNISPADQALLDRFVEQMRQICVELRESGQKVLSREAIRRFLTADLAFHMVLLRSTGNQRIHKIVEDTRVFLLIFCFKRHEHHTLKTVADIYLWHGRIRNAIRRGDAEAARQAMLGHLRVSKQGAIEFMSQHHRAEGDLDKELAALMPAGLDALGRELLQPAPDAASGRGGSRKGRGKNRRG